MEQWTRVDITVPPGALGLVVSKVMDRRGERSHVVVDGFRPIAATGEQGVLQQSGQVVKGSRLLGVNEHDFTDDKHPLSFEKIRDILINTSGVERVVRFLVPPVAANSTAAGAGTIPIGQGHARRFADDYALGKELGSGTFSVVREATLRATGEKFAIKCIKRAELSKDDLEALMAEVAILKEMQHPHIVKLYDVFQEEHYFFLVTEFMRGGELFERIVKKNFYSEREARDLVKVLLESIKFIHDANVVHRDLKPENLLLSSLEDDADIKLADFGFAKKVAVSEGLVTACGTPGYVAPEILQARPYGKEVDIWSIGVITYILLCGYPPFHHDNQGMLFRIIKSGRYEFDSPYWDDVSAEAKDLISKMLVLNPAERWTAEQLLQHKWITGEDVANVQLTTALEGLRRFNARRKFKAAVSTVKATISLTKSLTLGKDGSGSDDDSAHGEQNTTATSASAAPSNATTNPPPAPGSN